MDILGYSAFTEVAHKRGEQAEALKVIHGALTRGRHWIDENEPQGRYADLMKPDLYALKAFTDNIALGWPISNDAERELTGTLNMLARFQMEMVLEGFFVRGAVSVGDCYLDEVVVFGEALLEAHNGESKTARDPRIIMAGSAVSEAKKHFNYYVHPRYNRYLLQDADGQWFVNYLECAIHKQLPYQQMLLAHKSMVEQRLVQHKKDPPIWFRSRLGFAKVKDFVAGHYGGWIPGAAERPRPRAREHRQADGWRPTGFSRCSSRPVSSSRSGSGCCARRLRIKDAGSSSVTGQCGSPSMSLRCSCVGRISLPGSSRFATTAPLGKVLIYVALVLVRLCSLTSGPACHAQDQPLLVPVVDAQKPIPASKPSRAYSRKSFRVGMRACTGPHPFFAVLTSINE